ncbi:MAG TPA: glucuronate isomerase [Clostridiales bacterium]|nr:glucuronate isomerase [Clostridiales bacterium]
MKAFMDDNFLLTTETAKILYHNYANRMPIIDYHCHINPREIFENKTYDNLSEIWLGGDHYKWRSMRSNGIAEELITGRESTPYQKFEQWAATVPRLIGNPLYHWTHLELQRYFGIFKPLNPSTCAGIWAEANHQLHTMPVRSIIEKYNVRVICTTDDPIDDLKWHQLLRADDGFKTKVLPTFRPDKTVNIDKPGFNLYLDQLGEVCDITINSVDDLLLALQTRLSYFVENGCRAADHGLDYIVYSQNDNVDMILKKVRSGLSISQAEADAFKTVILKFCAAEYRKHNIVMQLHYGAVRNNNPNAMTSIGPDTGYDAINGRADSGASLGSLLGALQATDSLPRTIIYSLNPADNAQIGTIIGCFQSDEIAGKIQHGSAWWFNDTKTGMVEHLTSLANLSVLSNFVGMLTDSRSFLSYTRHEYFRRILCELLGTWVETGEYPADIAILGNIVEDICYRNALRYFNLEELLNE